MHTSTWCQFICRTAGCCDLADRRTLDLDDRWRVALDGTHGVTDREEDGREDDEHEDE